MDEDTFARGSGCQATEQQWKYCPVISDCTFRFQSVWPSNSSLKFRGLPSVLYPCYRASTYWNTNTVNTECSPYTPQVQVQACLWYVFHQRFASTWGFLYLKQNCLALVSEKRSQAISDA